MSNPKIVKYTAIQAENLSDVISCVVDFIQEGWQPYGSMCTSFRMKAGLAGQTASGCSQYIQPMVKYAKEEEPVRLQYGIDPV